MNSIKALALLLVFLGLIPSCRCPEIDPFYMPTAISAEAIWNNSLYTDFEDLTIAEAEGFELWVEFTELQYLAEQRPSFSFSHTLHATQPCPNDGEQGLKHKISTVLITSSAEFQGVTPGESINAFFHTLDYSQPVEDGESEFESVPIENALEIANQPFAFSSGFQFRLSELPGNNLEHIFTVTLAFDDGTILSGESAEVQF